MKKQSLNIVRDYNDTKFLRIAMQHVNEIFYGNYRDYLPITMKMLLHDMIMASLSSAGLLSDIVFQGGTCLQRVYDWPRLSEDLDFSNIGENSDERFLKFGNDFEAAVREELARIGFSDEEITVKRPRLEEKEQIVRRWVIRVNVGNKNMKQFVNIELANVPTYEVTQKTFTPLSGITNGKRIMVNVEPLEVIFNEKVFTLVNRRFLKCRDVFDVSLLSDRLNINKDFFFIKINDFGLTKNFVLEQIDVARKRLVSEETPARFSAEMSRFVMPQRTVDVKDDKVVASIIGKAVNVLDDVESMLKEKPMKHQRPRFPFSPYRPGSF